MPWKCDEILRTEPTPGGGRQVVGPRYRRGTVDIIDPETCRLLIVYLNDDREEGRMDVLPYTPLMSNVSRDGDRLSIDLEQGHRLHLLITGESGRESFLKALKDTNCITAVVGDCPTA